MTSNLDFNIFDTHSFKTLGIIDTSYYNPDIKIEGYKIEIQAPGYTYFSSPFFMPKTLNIFNSNSLGITRADCEDQLVDLPDGLYRIKYSICPNDLLFTEKFLLRTDKLECGYTQLFLNLELDNTTIYTSVDDKILREKLIMIEKFIQGGISAANNKNPKLAMDFYTKASYMVSSYTSLLGLNAC